MRWKVMYELYLIWKVSLNCLSFGNKKTTRARSFSLAHSQDFLKGLILLITRLSVGSLPLGCRAHGEPITWDRSVPQPSSFSTQRALWSSSLSKSARELLKNNVKCLPTRCFVNRTRGFVLHVHLFSLLIRNCLGASNLLADWCESTA